jgi:FAD/FMN-containing dehydrogenase
MNRTIREALGEILPAEALLRDFVVSLPPGWTAPVAAVAPTSLPQIAAVMERASREGWRVLPAGLCTWLGGGGAVEVDVVVSTRNLRGLTAYEPADLTFTADAGIPWATLREATRVNGQWLPLDPPGFGEGSLGAVVATGASGPLRQTYGAPRDHVLGVTMVSGDGRVLKWGGRVVKNVAGFDVTRLTVGSWGALGVVTSVSARLFPLPERDLTILVRAPSAEDLVGAARSMALSPLPFSAVELLEPVGAVSPRLEEGELKAALALRIAGSEAQVREAEARVLDEPSLRNDVGAGSALRLRDSESVAFHDALSRWEEGVPLVIRLSAMPSRLPSVLQEARELRTRMEASGGAGGWRQEVQRKQVGGAHGPGPTNRERPGYRIAVHVGLGVLRLGIHLPPQEGDAPETLAGDLRALRERLESAGGTLTVSQGPPALVRDVGVCGEAGPEAELIRGLRREFDPAGVLLAGRFVV